MLKEWTSTAKPLTKPSKVRDRLPVDINQYLLAYEKGWTLSDIAKATGHSRNTLSKLLRPSFSGNTEYIHSLLRKEKVFHFKVQAEKRAERLGIQTTKAQIKRAKRQSILGLRARMATSSEGNRIHKKIQREGSP